MTEISVEATFGSASIGVRSLFCAKKVQTTPCSVVRPFLLFVCIRAFALPQPWAFLPESAVRREVFAPPPLPNPSENASLHPVPAVLPAAFAKAAPPRSRRPAALRMTYFCLFVGPYQSVIPRAHPAHRSIFCLLLPPAVLSVRRLFSFFSRPASVCAPKNRRRDRLFCHSVRAVPARLRIPSKQLRYPSACAYNAVKGRCFCARRIS